MLYFIDELGYKRILMGTRRGVSLRFISMFLLKKSLRKCCKLYDIIHMKKNDDTLNVVQHPIL
jgi:hypothetical protein